MRILCVCHDEDDGTKRSELLEAHTQHNIGHLADFLFTAPVALADGVAPAGDDPRLCGSLYCLEIDGLAAARALMEADPFLQGAWRSIDYYDWDAATGAWDDEDTRPFGLGENFRCYALLASQPARAPDALMQGALVALGSTANASPSFRWASLVKTESIDAAASLAPSADKVFAVPIAIGRWVGISSLADFARYRTQLTGS